MAPNNSFKGALPTRLLGQRCPLRVFGSITHTRAIKPSTALLIFACLMSPGRLTGYMHFGTPWHTGVSDTATWRPSQHAGATPTHAEERMVWFIEWVDDGIGEMEVNGVVGINRVEYMEIDGWIWFYKWLGWNKYSWIDGSWWIQLILWMDWLK